MTKLYALITGATGGLGRAFSFELAKSNNLFLTGRSTEKLKKLADEIRSTYPSCDVLICPCDLQSKSSRQKMFEFIVENDVYFNELYNVAGCDIQKSFVKYTEDKIVFQSRVLFESTVSVTRFALSRNVNGLKILTISSLCGTLPMPYFAIYSSLKGALVSFFDSLRFELKNDKRFTVTTILPGSIPTREDIILDIEKQGLTGKLSKKSPEFIVKKSIKALNRRKKNYIPGFYNRLVNFFQSITPKFIKMKIIAKKFSKKEKDAF